VKLIASVTVRQSLPLNLSFRSHSQASKLQSSIHRSQHWLPQHRPQVVREEAS